MNLKKIGKVFTRKFDGTGPSFYEKRIYRAAVSQRLRNTAVMLVQYGRGYYRNSVRPHLGFSPSFDVICPTAQLPGYLSMG